MPITDLPEAARIAAAQSGLLAWYAAHRRDLPWRQTRDPYHILVSEMMLQQTQVPRVLPRYHAWLAQFPTLAALAAAPTADVLRAWSGLGYNSRAVRLQQVARLAVAQYNGRLPAAVDELRALPGIGDYTARAIACFAYEQDVPVLDTNVKRVLHRVFAGPEAPRPRLTDRQLWALAERAVPAGQGYDWNQALMDFGATVCTARKPVCLVCPLRDCCLAMPAIGTALAEQQRVRRHAARTGAARATPFTSTTRYYRGQTLRVLGTLAGGDSIALDDLGPRVKPGYTAADRPWLHGLVSQLARDGLVALRAASPASYQVATVREAAAAYTVADTDDELVAVRVSLPEA
ncbi:MAG: A/G-specific adenine glycosylase [Thermomicrobiales bacterium]